MRLCRIGSSSKRAEVVIVDVTPRALRHRLQRGAIYPPDRAKSESERMFQEPVLVALRELAIRQTAQVLEARQSGQAPDAHLDKILVNITADPSAAMLLRRARRVADHLPGGVHCCLCLFQG